MVRAKAMSLSRVSTTLRGSYNFLPKQLKTLVQDLGRPIPMNYLLRADLTAMDARRSIVLRVWTELGCLSSGAHTSLCRTELGVEERGRAADSCAMGQCRTPS